MHHYPSPKSDSCVGISQAAPNSSDYPDRPHLRLSGPMRWNMQARHLGESAAIKHLRALLNASENRKRARRSADSQRIDVTLEAIVLNLYRHSSGGFPYRSYSRRNEDYIGCAPHPLVSLNSVSVVVAFLTGHGFAEHFQGCYLREANPFAMGQVGKGYQSRLKATPQLCGLMEEFGAPVESVPEDELRPIRLRTPIDGPNGSKRNLTFEPTEETERWAERVATGNRVRASARITLPPELQERIDRSAVNLHRIFNNGVFHEGGRFYGGWWQNVERAVRKLIRINGEPVVELDYGSIQPRICYHLEHVPLAPEQDAYSVSGRDPQVYRNAIKNVVVRLLGMSKEQRQMRRQGDQLGLFPTTKAFRTFVSEVEASLHAIQPWLRAGRIGQVQFIESEIADEVLWVLAKQSIPCLPIHDSFIVPASAEVELGRAMYAAYRSCLHHVTWVQSVPTITGWTSAEAEQLSRKVTINPA